MRINMEDGYLARQERRFVWDRRDAYPTKRRTGVSPV